jgi:hypothetical protein
VCIDLHCAERSGFTGGPVRFDDGTGNTGGSRLKNNSDLTSLNSHPFTSLGAHLLRRAPTGITATVEDSRPESWFL